MKAAQSAVADAVGLGVERPRGHAVHEEQREVTGDQTAQLIEAATCEAGATPPGTGYRRRTRVHGDDGIERCFRHFCFVLFCGPVFASSCVSCEGAWDADAKDAKMVFF